MSIATLSYWRAGHRRPEQPASLEALDALEEILGVPAGHLRTKLEMTRRSPGSGTRKSLDEVMPQGDRVRELLTDLGFPQTSSLLELATQVTVDMDERGHGSSYTARGVFRGVRDGVDRLPFVFWMEGPDAELPKFEPMHGCEMGRSVVDAEAGIYALELLLELPLGGGGEHGPGAPGAHPTPGDGRDVVRTRAGASDERDLVVGPVPPGQGSRTRRGLHQDRGLGGDLPSRDCGAPVHALPGPERRPGPGGDPLVLVTVCVGSWRSAWCRLSALADWVLT